MLKNFQVGFSPLLNGAFSWNEIFVFSGGQICIQKKKIFVMRTKKLIVLMQNWHVSSIIIRSKLNLLTEPENKNKQAA